MGIALTLAFLHELFTFYNTSIKLKIPANLAFSGGIDERAKIVSIGNEGYIKSKVRCVFFSAINSIILHRNDEETAKSELKKLQENYPERKIRIIGIEEFDDLINRRDLVDIKRQNTLVRTGKFIRKQKIALIVLIISLLGLLYANIDFDNNPAYLTNFKNIVYVHNKNGRILWTKKIYEDIDKPYINKDNMGLYEKIININGDNDNEVLLSDYVIKKSSSIYDIFVACFNYSGKLLWKYKFDDAVITEKDIHTRTYNSLIVDTLTENGKPQIVLVSRNDPLYPSAIYKLDAVTGERLQGTFWHAGQISGAALGDFDDNGKKEIVATAVSNCFEHCVLFSIDIDNLEGQGPADNTYSFIGIPSAKLNKYILLPKTDLTDYYKMRFNTLQRYILLYDERDKNFSFSSSEGDPSKFDAGISYKVNNKLTDINIFIGDSFQVIRDSLVAKGLLNKPYSNTKEYLYILKKQIKYWDGKEFKRMY